MQSINVCDTGYVSAKLYPLATVLNLIFERKQLANDNLNNTLTVRFMQFIKINSQITLVFVPIVKFMHHKILT